MKPADLKVALKARQPVFGFMISATASMRWGRMFAGSTLDFVVIDSAASPTTPRRLSLANDIAEKLFALVMLGDDRAIAATYVMGKLAYAN